MKKEKQIVILFSRLSDYFLSTLISFLDSNEGFSFIVFKEEPDEKEAPYSLKLNHDKIVFLNNKFYDKKNLLDTVKEIDPVLILCSGWSNSNYMFIVRKLHKKTKVILTMDNHWHGSIRQYFGCIYSWLFLRNKFRGVWVPGLPQVHFAKLLGFSRKKIYTGWYVANSDFSESPIENVPERFVFVGRYIPKKGIKLLIRAFTDAKKEFPTNHWELHCIGTGELEGDLPNHPAIKHLGFIQPQELKMEADKGGVLVLPSFFEPWGLVIHEFALAGFPLIASDKVGAASQFITQENGHIFKSKHRDELKRALVSIMNSSKDELLSMGKKSRELGEMVNNEKWNETLNTFLKR